jgi:hypothetical protein
MRKLREANLTERKKAYLELRIGDQLEWYRKKARWNKDRAIYWFGGLVVCNVIAIGFALVRIAYPSVHHWPTDIFVAASASLLAWIQTKKFQELAGSYTLTAHEIMLMRGTLNQNASEREFSAFVGDAENAFSREHTQWQARRDKE